MFSKLKQNTTLSRAQVAKEIQANSSIWIVYNYDKLTTIKTKLLFPQIATAIASAILAIITLLITAIGLYGILSYSSQMRRFEIGTRMAIGAKGKGIIAMVI